MPMTMIAEQPAFLQLYRKDDDALRAELSEGLLAAQAVTSPKFLYDPLGSRLFEAICELPEYYPTRTEAAIFDMHLSDIVASTGRGRVLIDLGAGSCAKAARLFPALRPRDYVPVDISVDFLQEAVEGLRQRFPHIRMTGLGMDFSQALELPDFIPADKRLFFYPGSSIGNFAPAQALSLLLAMRNTCGEDGGLLIGVDLVKDARLLNAAYDDALGVTASFNLNLLRHLNSLVDADFDVRDWRHRAFWQPDQGRVEMHLEACHHVVVSWRGGQRHFREGERIHTESSYKYTRQGFMRLLERAGFEPAGAWTDEREWFLVCHARAARR